VVQAAISANVGKPVQQAVSPTSLQLALEDEAVQEKVASYRNALANTLVGKVRVVGYAIAVNGKVTGAEVFGSSTLLAKAWPKAIYAAAVEALAEDRTRTPADPRRRRRYLGGRHRPRGQGDLRGGRPPGGGHHLCL
jgi:hypothetical protein